MLVGKATAGGGACFSSAHSPVWVGGVQGLVARAGGGPEATNDEWHYRAASTHAVPRVLVGAPSRKYLVRSQLSCRVGPRRHGVSARASLGRAVRRRCWAALAAVRIAVRCTTAG
jgi:hypothetical protein